MVSGAITKLKIPSVSGFEFQIKYTETDKKSHTHEIGLHAHNELEIYVNLAGDVSFLVENNLYDLSRGDVIIARPGEHHHCVYRSDAPHKLFWILFDCKRNQAILDVLQPDFCENYLSPPKELREELLELCYALHNATLTEEEKLYAFFRIFAIFKKSKTALSHQPSAMPRELREMIAYIEGHIGEEITVAKLAEAFFISRSSLERLFKEYLDITPLKYIRKKRLVLATQMLQEGKTVLNAGSSVGYTDSSYFIELFKQYHGLTPYQYKKRYKES